MEDQNSLVMQLREAIQRLEQELLALRGQEVHMKREIRRHKKALKALANTGREEHHV